MTIDERMNNLLTDLGSETFLPCTQKKNVTQRNGGAHLTACLGQHEGLDRNGRTKFFYAIDCKLAQSLCPSCLAYFCVAVARNALIRAQRNAQLSAEIKKINAHPVGTIEPGKGYVEAAIDGEGTKTFAKLEVKEQPFNAVGSNPPGTALPRPAGVSQASEAALDKMIAEVKAKAPSCEMVEGCKNPVTHLDEKGYVYCTPCAVMRKAHGRRCRQLRPAELKKISTGAVLAKY